MAKVLLFSGLMLYLSFSLVKCASNLQCQVASHCSCKFNDYDEITIKGLIPTEAKDKFLSDAQGNYTYFFSGCENQEFKPQEYGLNTSTTLTGSLIKCFRNISEIQRNVTNGNLTEIVNIPVITDSCTVLGNAEKILFDLSADDVKSFQIVYNEPNRSSLASVRLVCDNYDRNDLKISNINSDVLTLYSHIVCTKHTNSTGLSSGSVFLIIFFVGLGLYLIGGGLLMYTMRGARGVEVIPHIDFWRSIPGLVRDGIIYIFSGCRPVSISSAETYDRI